MRGEERDNNKKVVLIGRLGLNFPGGFLRNIYFCCFIVSRGRLGGGMLLFLFCEGLSAIKVAINNRQQQLGISSK